MRKTFLIIGLGRFGMAIIKTLGDLNADVIAIDVDEKAVEEASNYVEHCAICDATRINALKEIAADSYDHAVVAIGNNLQATILTIINLKELGIKKISVRVDSNEYVKVMERLGADEIIIPEDEAAISFANQIISDTILEYHPISKDFSMVKIKVGDKFEEHSIVDLDVRNKFDINIVGITRNHTFYQPKATDTIRSGDILTVFGKSSKINKFDRFLN